VIIENAWGTLKGKLQWKDIEKILGENPEVSASIVDQTEGSRRQRGYPSSVNEAMAFRGNYQKEDYRLKFAYDIDAAEYQR